MPDTLFLLLAGHAVADYPLQGEFLANGKNRHTPLGKEWWKIALPMHSLIQGGMVAIITHSTLLGLIETVLHCAIDYAKCEQWIDIKQDQALHIACKIAYAVFLGDSPCLT